jgi:hypothetical protein
MTNIARPGPSVIMRRSPLVETLHPFAEMAFVDTPLAADLESAKFFSLDHSHYCSTGQSQQLGGFLDGQQAYRLVTVFHSAPKLSNADAMTLLSIAARLLEKAAACGPSVTVQKSSCYP